MVNNMGEVNEADQNMIKAGVMKVSASIGLKWPVPMDHLLGLRFCRLSILKAEGKFQADKQA